MTDEIKLRAPPKNYRSKVWAYFRFREGNNDKPTCKLCFADIMCKAGNTTNLANHLKRKHNIALSSASATATSTGASSTAEKSPGLSAPNKSSATLSDMKIPEMFKMSQKLSASSDRHKALTQAIATFIALDMRPYSVVENKGFKYLMSIAEPRYNIPSRTHFAQTVLPGLYTSVKTRVQHELSQCESVAITTDSWTSRATENYLTVTAHALSTVDWHISSYTLETKAFTQSHTADNLSASLNNTVKLWDLQRHGKGPVVTTDNAMNIVKAVRLCELTHVPCFAHTLNLATQKGLQTKEMTGVLSKVRRVVGLFHRSTTAAAVKDEPNETTSTDLPAQPALPLLPALPAEEPPSEPQEKKPRLAPDTPESPQAPWKLFLGMFLSQELSQLSLWNSLLEQN